MDEISQEYIPDLKLSLNNIIHSMNCSYYAICLYTTTYTKHIVLQTNIDDFIYNPTELIQNNIISNTYENEFCIQTPLEILSICILPMFVEKDKYIGCLFLINNYSNNFTIDQLSDNNTNITNCKIILHNTRLLLELNEFNKLTNQDLFLANMSHEIRTPLNGIIGYNQLLVQTEMSNVQQNYIKNMNQCSIQLMQIINDILDFSKLSSGKMNISTECFSLDEISETLANALGTRMNNKRQRLQISISKSVPRFILMDKHKLIQICINLITNASKFSDINKSIFLNIKTINDTTLHISVQDYGIGISKCDIEKLFNVFSQLKTQTNKASGSGLGLAIVKKLVSLLDGNVSVISSPNKGSTFSFTCKFEQYEEYQDNISNLECLIDKTVLIVDDVPDNRILLSEIIYGFNMNPVVCATAVEALSIILSDRYDVDIALIDICMPGISGSELANIIKKEKPLLPLVALSSLDSFVKTSDFEYKIDKPVNKAQLYNCMSRLLHPSNILEKEPCLKVASSDIKILLAEDVKYNTDILVNFLAKSNYTNIDTVENGQECIEMIKLSYEKQILYDVLILDLRMPVLDGYGVLKHLHQEGLNIPDIIITTASIMDVDRSKCIDYGINHFVTKPINYNKLTSILS
jgi:signal transduction histidine kinase/DNA-binding response OmpR family regulator